MYHYIAIEGNIGAGKTQLAQMAAAHFNKTLILETFANNQYLEHFYQDPEQYAFPLEVSFLVERHQQLTLQLAKDDLFSPGFVSDYIFEKSLIFARNNLTTDQYHLFQRLFETFDQQLTQPELIVYLHRPVEVLMNQIEQRGRPFEKAIAGEYLQEIEEAYRAYFHQVSDKRVLWVNLGDKDFLENREMRDWLIGLLEKPHEQKFQVVEVG